MASPSIKYRVLDNDSSGDYSDDEVKGIPPFEARYLRSRSHEQQQKRARVGNIILLTAEILRSIG
jgi:hypothetical protein